MTMNTGLFSELQEFIVNKGGVDYAEVTRDAKLEEDLGIYGDDAIELLVAYGKNFLLILATLWQPIILALKEILFYQLLFE